MANYFQVDLDTLGSMASSLKSAEDQMDAALRTMAGSQGGDIGTNEINNAANEFQETWKYGFFQLKSMIEKLSDGVGKSHDFYQQADQSIEKAMQSINGGLGGAVK